MVVFGAGPRVGDGIGQQTWLLKRAQELAAVVEAQSGMVKAFLGRWEMTRSRLQRLPAHLAALADSPCFLSNPLCCELLQGVVGSLEQGKALAERCSDLKYGGKLQMQSDLDSLATKLDLHLHDCELVMKSGVLGEAPFAVAHTNPGSSREAVRWSVVDLIARLQIGNADSKHRALNSLVELMEEDDKNVLVVAGQGGIPALVHLLDSSLPAIREKAAAAICTLALADTCEHLIVSEGAIAPLVRLLESGSSVAKEKAAVALQALAFAAENARAVAAHGGAPPLIEICRSGTPGAQAAAAGSLRNLAGIAETRSGIAEEGGIPVLVNLVESGTPLAKEHAAAALQNLALNDDEMRQAVVAAGGVQPLLRYLDGATTPKAQEIAMGALRNLAASPANAHHLIAAGFLARLVAVLRHGALTAQHTAAAAVCHLAFSVDSRRALGEAGVIPPLVRMLDAKTSTAQECAAQALATLLLLDANRTRFLQEDKGITALVALLDSRNMSISKQYPISALSTLVHTRRCRKQMISAGACYHLGMLAQRDIAGASKLLERLERGKLRSIFSLASS